MELDLKKFVVWYGYILIEGLVLIDDKLILCGKFLVDYNYDVEVCVFS